MVGEQVMAADRVRVRAVISLLFREPSIGSTETSDTSSAQVSRTLRLCAQRKGWMRFEREVVNDGQLRCANPQQ